MGVLGPFAWFPFLFFLFFFGGGEGGFLFGFLFSLLGMGFHGLLAMSRSLARITARTAGVETRDLRMGTLVIFGCHAVGPPDPDSN